ncbi:MAG: DUF6094 domain-containing protein [Thermodesulfobacteriota bacterium]
MARIASQEKLGYYKTPVCVVQQIKAGLSIGPNVRMLDPCCGTGEALQLLAAGTNAEALGIELEKGRYEKAKEVLDTVLFADALSEAAVSISSIDLLWLNPPYDLDEGDFTQHRQRLEFLFLQKYLPVLVKNGVLVFIAPYRTIRRSDVGSLLSRLADIELFRFPDGEFEAFEQVVVIGRKKMLLRSEIEENHETLCCQNAECLPTTTEIRQKGITLVASESKRPLVFKANHIDPAEIQPLTSVLRDLFLKEVTPSRLTDAHPLMPLRQGHLAMLLAAGYVNGELKDGNGEYLVIKGTVKKVETVSEESTEHFHIKKTVEKVEITVRALNMATGDIETIG